jgi:hypothetical protein
VGSAAVDSEPHRRQEHAHDRAVTEARGHRADAAMPADDPVDGGEPEAPPEHLGGEEGLGDAPPGLLAHAAARILDLEAEVLALGHLPGSDGAPEILPGEPAGARPDRDHAPVVGDGLDGVGDERHHHQAELSGIALDRGQSEPQIGLDGHVTGHHRPQEPQHVAHQRRQVDQLHHEPCLARVRLELATEVAGAARGLLHLDQAGAGRARFGELGQGESGPSQDGHRPASGTRSSTSGSSSWADTGCRRG